MSERLYLHLPAQPNQSCNWMVYNHAEQEIIASGELVNIQELNRLKGHALDKPVDVLIPTQTTSILSAQLPEKGTRQALKALPFMLEDELSESVEQLHFCATKVVNNQVDVCVVNHQQMQLWLSWLADAQIQPNRIVPDALALPTPEMGCWSVLEINGKYLIKTAKSKGMVIAPDWFPMVAQRTVKAAINDEQPIPVIEAYSPLEVPMMSVEQQQLDLPMLLLAKGVDQVDINLLSGVYAPKSDFSNYLLPWKKVAIAASVCLGLALVNKGVNQYHYNQQAQAYKEQAEATYRQLFPQEKRIIGVKRQIDKKLSELNGGNGGGQFLSMLEQLSQAFSQVKQLKPTGMRFDNKRNELRLQVSANSFAEVEAFQQLAAQNFKLKVGSMSQNDGLVTGTITITEL
ncbi:type II secretion system protein GspL [Paraferrimonas sp. SM1919]|uniref:type II secretion system protein GspL n=1 Tax=Paraferrimonas sp. SM1919 TaxID=2662263 RepID=UPI0013D0928C|nr:type II secretion system protein GspL [Paraferrimonas sp. SM1919]